MKTIKLAALLLTSASVLALGVIGFRSAFNQRINPAVSAPGSPASDRTDKRILRAMQVIEKMPDRSEGYNQLASAYMQKARETANFDFNTNAGDAITRSLRVEPDNYDALKLRAKLELTYHRFSEDHALALRGKTHARLAAGDIQGAVVLCKREQNSADAAQMLGELYTLLGDEGAARKEYEKFETLEPENAVVERSWRHLLNYWLDHDRNLGESLTLARREYERRKDIFTCDSLSWAFFKNGLLAEAKKLMNEALRTGTKDARINYHAGIIYKTLSMRDKAAQHLRVAAALNSTFDPVQAESAKKMLAKLDLR